MQPHDVFAYLDHAQLRHSPPCLKDMEELLRALGDPQSAFCAVHIAGTNGKGSTAAMLDSILRRAGYKTGLFTSPFIHRFHERIRVNGAEISDAALCAHAAHVRAAEESEGLRLNFFQIVTAMGFLHFAAEHCDIAVVEAGLGGRLDPTNTLPCPAAAVITRIGLDHMALLGDTAEAIAWEKAGIIKPGGDVVLLSQTAEVEQVVEAVCGEKSAHLYRADVPVSEIKDGALVLHSELGPLALGLSGSFQAENAAVALEAVHVLRKSGFSIPNSAVREGLLCARWPARFELLSRDPVLLLDGAHNPQGAQSLCDSLRAYYPGRACVFLMAGMRDKDYIGCIRAVAPLARAMIAVPLNEARALPAPMLADAMRPCCATVRQANSVEDGVRMALSLAQPEDVICAFGSLHLAGPVRAHMQRI